METNRVVENIGMHSIGNGKILAYGIGADIVQMFGAPYSSPSFMKLTLNNETLTTKSERKAGTSNWEHKIFDHNILVGEIIDFANENLCCIVRKIKVNKDIKFSININSSFSYMENTKRFESYSVCRGRKRSRHIWQVSKPYKNIP